METEIYKYKYEALKYKTEYKILITKLQKLSTSLNEDKGTFIEDINSDYNKGLIYSSRSAARRIKEIIEKEDI